MNEAPASRWGSVPIVTLPSEPYRRAPIVEALIDVRVGGGDDDGALPVLMTLLTPEEGFRDPARIFDIQGELTVTDLEVLAGTTTAEHVGYQFSRDDGSRAAWVQVDRFGFSWIGAYEHWNAFAAEFNDYWPRYLTLRRPAIIAGVAVRFINRIVVPSPFVEMKDYLRTAVDVSPYLPQAVSELFMRVEIPLGPAADVVAVVTSAIEFTGDRHATTLVLDIEVRKPLLGVAAHDTRTLTAALGELREAKNYVFEACITDATRRLIE